GYRMALSLGGEVSGPCTEASRKGIYLQNAGASRELSWFVRPATVSYFLRNSLDPFGEVRRVQNLVPHRVRSRRAPLRAQPGRPLGGGNRPLDGEARPAALEDREPRRGQELHTGQNGEPRLPDQHQPLRLRRAPPGQGRA